MDYFKIYNHRITNNGLNSKEKIMKFGQKEYLNFIKQSPTREIMVGDNGEFECSFQSNKFSDSKNLRYLVCKHDFSLKLGEIIHKQDGTIWIIIRHEPHPFNVDNRYVALQCKHKIKWLNSMKKLQETPCCIVGTMDNKIKENFRTWNNMITPQPNKTLEIILPYFPIKKGTKMIIDDEAWYVVDYDKITVKGVMYISLTESEINSFEDNLEDDIADYDKINDYQFYSAFSEYEIVKNKIFQPEIFIMKNGNRVNKDFDFYAENENVEIDKKNIVCIENGQYEIKAKSKDDESFYYSFIINCVDSPEKSDYFLIGDSRIKWGRESEYKIFYYDNNEKIEKIPTVNVIEGSNLVTVKENKIIANSNNETGKIKVEFITEDFKIEKTIEIISLWS